MQTMGMEEYAKHRGCTKVAVWKAIQHGRITAKMEKVNGGRKPEYRIDPVIADAEWIKNTKNNNTAKILHDGQSTKVGHPTKEQSEAIQVIREAKKKAKAEKAQKRISEREKLGKGPTQADLRDIGQNAAGNGGKDGLDGSEGMTVHQRRAFAETRKAEAAATLAEMDLAKEQKALVYAEEVEDYISSKIATARDSLMHAPKSFRIQFKDAPAEYAEWLDEYIRAALQNLAGVENVAGMDA